MSKRDKPLALAADTLCIFEMYCTTWPDTGMPGACCRSCQESIASPRYQEIIFISQVIQRVEFFSRSASGWIYHQYGPGQSFFLTSLDIEIGVRQLYLRLSIPAAVKEVKDSRQNGQHAVALVLAT